MVAIQFNIVDTRYERSYRFRGLATCSGEAIICGGRGPVPLIKK